MIYLYFLITFSLIIYFITLCLFIIGLLKKPYKTSKSKKIINVSVIICVKNGQDSILNIISDLKNQTYKDNVEFIIVDDMSMDSTKNMILNNIKNDVRFKYISSKFGNKKLSHKKRAIDAGIEHSEYDYLLFTDVDCRLNNKWIESMMKHYQYNIDYIVGCSIINKPNTLVSFFQRLDYYMLMISSFSACNLGIPLACTGQNQSYKKSLYKSIKGFSKIEGLLQGDDSIFLQLLRKNSKLNVVFSSNCDSHVRAKAHHNWKDLLLQRMRWAGDANIMWKYNKLFFIIILATFLSNLFFIVSPIIIFSSFNLILILLFVKFLLEFILYFAGMKKINKKLNLIQFVYWFVLQIPYVVLIGILSFFAPILSWRGRSAN